VPAPFRGVPGGLQQLPDRIAHRIAGRAHPPCLDGVATDPDLPAKLWSDLLRRRHLPP